MGIQWVAVTRIILTPRNPLKNQWVLEDTKIRFLGENFRNLQGQSVDFFREGIPSPSEKWWYMWKSHLAFRGDIFQWTEWPEMTLSRHSTVCPSGFEERTGDWANVWLARKKFLYSSLSFTKRHWSPYFSTSSQEVLLMSNRQFQVN